MDFSCVKDCSKCCIEREYYPTIKFGKVGVLILPEEKERIELLAEKNGIKVTIVPRIGISKKESGRPEKILAYQMMGKDLDGNVCPFLKQNLVKDRPMEVLHVKFIMTDRLHAEHIL